MALDVGVGIADRCSEDSLDVPQAVGRVEWAYRCKHIGKRTYEAMLLEDDSDARRARPKYPIFVKFPEKLVWKAPMDPNAPCDVPPEYNSIVSCTSSCYTPDQRLAFIVADEDNPIKKIIKWIDIETAFNKKLPNVLAVAPESTLDNIKYMSVSVSAYSHEFKDAWNDILEFRTAHGGKQPSYIGWRWAHPRSEFILNWRCVCSC